MKYRAYNPAFDVTPAKLITGIITEAGILQAPYSKQIKKALALLFILNLVVLNAIFNACFANPSVNLSAKPSSTIAQKSQPAESAHDASSLRRVDFRVTGKSCPVCLHHMQDRIKELPGVLKAAIMLSPPYGGVVIYDPNKVKTNQIFEKAQEGVPEAGFEDKVEISIKSLPLVLVPAAAAISDKSSKEDNQ